jgi:hypothetical protein
MRAYVLSRHAHVATAPRRGAKPGQAAERMLGGANSRNLRNRV